MNVSGEGGRRRGVDCGASDCDRDFSATLVVAGSKAEPSVLLAGNAPLGIAQRIAVHSATHDATTKLWRCRGVGLAIDPRVVIVLSKHHRRK